MPQMRIIVGSIDNFFRLVRWRVQRSKHPVENRQTVAEIFIEMDRIVRVVDLDDEPAKRRCGRSFR